MEGIIAETLLPQEGWRVCGGGGGGWTKAKRKAAKALLLMGGKEKVRGCPRYLTWRKDRRFHAGHAEEKLLLRQASGGGND